MAELGATGTSVAICTADNPADLRRALQSLSTDTSTSTTPHEILVIDNTPTGTARKIVDESRAHCASSLRYVGEPRPGLSVARNRAILESRFDCVAFLDDDVEVEKGWLGEINRIFVETGCAVAAGRVVPRYAHEPPPWLLREKLTTIGSLDRGRLRVPISANEVLGSNFAVRRSWFDKVGTFESDLGRVGTSLLSGEETNFCSRVVGQGGELLYCPGASVEHRVRHVEMTRGWQLRRAYWGGRTAQRISDPAHRTQTVAGDPKARLRTTGRLRKFLDRRLAGESLFGELLHASWLVGRKTEKFRRRA